MRELSLFSGAGGGLLGTHLLGWTPIGYVEYDDYCQRVIRQRIIDGVLPNAPIFGDVRAFISSGCAGLYRGVTDVISGGFPCQPFSTAGKRLGVDDERNMWPATVECIRLIRPRYAFLENVPGILSSGYFGTILGDLAESGYSVRWRILSAAELGAPHRRDRLWVVAHCQSERARRLPVRQGRSQQASTDANGCGQDVAHAQRPQNNAQWRDSQPRWDTVGWDAKATQRNNGQADPDSVDGCGSLGDTTGAGLSNGRNETLGRSAQGDSLMQSQRPNWWQVEPALGRVVDGYAGRVDELKAIGNAQVASVVRAAWHLLTA